MVLGAGDTFRAAGVEQLEIWAQRAGVAFVIDTDGKLVGEEPLCSFTVMFPPLSPMSIRFAALVPVTVSVPLESELLSKRRASSPSAFIWASSLEKCELLKRRRESHSISSEPESRSES